MNHGSQAFPKNAAVQGCPWSSSRKTIVRRVIGAPDLQEPLSAVLVVPEPVLGHLILKGCLFAQADGSVP